MSFENVEQINKKGETKECLRPIMQSANMSGVINFIEGILPQIINHRNQLRHYRNTIEAFRNHFDALFLDIDFSENLQISVKYEPQSLHWHHQQLTVHSGILKIHGEKLTNLTYRTT